MKEKISNMFKETGDIIIEGIAPVLIGFFIVITLSLVLFKYATVLHGFLF